MMEDRSPFRPPEPLNSWLFPFLIALGLNVLLFGLMPRLVSDVPAYTEPPAMQNAIDVFRMKRPEPPEPEKEKPRPVENEKPPEQKPVSQSLFREKPVIKPKMPFEINSRLPAGPGIVPTLDVEKYALGGPAVFEESVLDKPIRALVEVNPVYPLRAQRMGIEGRVKIRFLITEAGLVESPEVVESEPPGMYDKSVLAAVAACRFSPPTVNGQPVKAMYTRTFTFDLSDE